MTEAAVLKRVRKVLDDVGGFVVKIHGSPMQRRGMPDLLWVYRGRAIFIETKGDGGTVSKLQSKIAAKLAYIGGARYWAVWPKDLEAFERVVRATVEAINDEQDRTR